MAYTRSANIKFREFYEATNETNEANCRTNETNERNTLNEEAQKKTKKKRNTVCAIRKQNGYRHFLIRFMSIFFGVRFFRWILRPEIRFEIEFSLK